MNYRFTAGVWCLALSAWCWAYISVSAVTAAGGFAFTASHLEKPQVTKGSCPAIRCLAQARHALTPALLRGPAAIGHPWPGAATAASLPRCPLRNTCVRPLEKGASRSGSKAKAKATARSTASRAGSQSDGVHPGKIGRLTGRHRSDAATRPHKKSKHI